MVAKHTPGPWFINECFIESQYCDIAELIFPAESEEMYNANLSLIAAAPELLEALKELQKSYWIDDPDIASDAIIAAGEAIAKAEGK